ncbi:MAG: hypothetical protein ACTHKC_06695 [Candidatus Nitrosocosmicus sp.]
MSITSATALMSRVFARILKIENRIPFLWVKLSFEPCLPRSIGLLPVVSS